MKQAKVKVTAFIDNGGSIYGNAYDDIPIYTNDEICIYLEENKNYIVIVALLDILSYKKIEHEINIKLNVYNNLECFFFSQLRSFNKIFGLDKKPEFSAYLGEDIDILIENKERIIHTYNVLEEQLSKKCFLEILHYYILPNFFSFTISPFSDLYFAYDLYERIENEVFVDCGSYDGDTLYNFIKKQNGLYKEYIAIEADKINYERLRNDVEVQKLDRVKVIQAFVSNKCKEVGFIDRGTSYSKGEDGGDMILTSTLDTLVYNNAPTFIKVCVEGADVEAIIGAEKIIKDYMPIIAVQGHHKAEHLWEIIEAIEDFNEKNYKFFLRNYMGITQFVFYAIPLQRIKTDLIGGIR